MAKSCATGLLSLKIPPLLSMLLVPWKYFIELKEQQPTEEEKS
jgi:hypothetical protein